MNIEELTSAEIEWMNENHTCPDCQRGALLIGPRGGSSVNLKCNDPACRHEFWVGAYVVNFMARVWSGGRLDRDEPTYYSEETLW